MNRFISIKVAKIVATGLAVMMPYGQATPSHAQAVASSSPAFGVVTLNVDRTEEHKAVFLSYLDGVVERFQKDYKSEENPYRSAIEMFSQKAHSPEFVLIQTPAGADTTFASVLYEETRERETGKKKLITKLVINWESFNRIRARGETDKVFTALLDEALIKEGVTLMDMEKNPDFYFELDRMDDLFSKSKRDLNNELYVDMLRTLGVWHVRGEEVGYSLGIQFLRSKDVTRNDLARKAQSETDPHLRGIPYRIWLLYDKSPELFRKNILLEDVASGFQPLVEALLQSEGTSMTQSSLTGERTVRPGDFRFLSDKEYAIYLNKDPSPLFLGLQSRQPTTILERDLPKGLLTAA